jgi:cell division topological specificity factor
MNLFRFHRPIRSAPVARERLQVLLEYERRVVTQTDPIALMREEILAVVRRYVTVDYDKVQVTVDRGASFIVAIEIPDWDCLNAIARHVSGGERASLQVYR